MVTGLAIDANADGVALEKLAELIALRQRYMKNEMTEDAVTATALNVVTSLKAMAKVAPWRPSQKVPEGSFTIEHTNLYGGFTKGHKICARIGSNRGVRSPIRPIIAVNPSDRAVLKSRVFAVKTANRYDTFSQSVNAPADCWCVLAENEEAVRKLMVADPKRFVKRIFTKEGGLLRYSLSIAQSRVYSKADKAELTGVMSERVKSLGDSVAVIDKGGSDGKFFIQVSDRLNYSLAGLDGGAGALTTALQKAANRTAGILNSKFAGYKFQDPIPTPFPEISGRSSQ